MEEHVEELLAIEMIDTGHSGEDKDQGRVRWVVAALFKKTIHLRCSCGDFQ